MNELKLFSAELRRGWIQFIRYPAEAISGIFIITALFYGLFLGAKYVAGPGLQLGDRLDAIIVSYVLWTLVTFILFNTTGTLQNEAQTGTLEQLFLTPFGAPRVFLTRAIADLFIQFVLISTILILISLLTGRYLSFPPALFLPLIAVIMGAYGISFALGSLALLLKRVQQLLGVVQFALLFLMTISTESLTGSLKILGFLLPMTTGAGLLRDLMARQQPLNFTLLGFALLNGLFYFGLGLLLFRWAERETKRRGRLSGY
ncbi:MAG: ABC transporter permease [Leptolyngbyaceae cyanobacterium CSU_1_3]|nr:ABC transporter permease [Leptolyngbyaceae cyanobacterium CSU_1_3]